MESTGMIDIERKIEPNPDTHRLKQIILRKRSVPVIIIAVSSAIILTSIVFLIYYNHFNYQNNYELCMTPLCIYEASKVLKNMDSGIEPCDDFYKFACGNFIKKTTIPEDQVVVDSFSLVRDKVQEQLKKSFESINVTNEPLKPFKLIKNLYNVCLNKTAIEEKGLEPLQNTLKKLGNWPVLNGDSWNSSEFSWIESLYKFKDAGYSIDYFFDLSIEYDSKNTTKRLLDLDQPSLQLHREYFIKGLKNDVVNAYFEYMVDIAVILGANKTRARKELLESLQFEIKLAKITVPQEKRRNATELYNPLTIKELSKKFQTIPWKSFFNLLLSPVTQVDDNDIVNVKEPYFILEFEKLMKNTSKIILANYMIWKAVYESIFTLNDNVRNRQLKFYTTLNGKTEETYRWKECVKVVTNSLPLGVSALYVREYFDEDSKETMIKMVGDIKHQFVKILENVEWMDDVTRKNALEKVRSMTTHIAYPDELLDDKKLEDFYRNLEVTGDNYLESYLNTTLFHANYAFGQLKELVNKNDWIFHGSLSASVNGFYSFNENSITLPAAILQEAFFKNGRPNYMNYGSIGYVIGHEITHGFDDTGRQFDKNGDLVDWWAQSTKEKYLDKAQCIIYQYGNYTVEEIGRNLNGINTQGENIADNGGIKIAYLAYKDWISKYGEELRLPGLAKYNSQQMFWISAASIECSSYKPEVLNFVLNHDFHSLEEFRILDALSNIKEFSSDFGCPVKSKMNPEKICTVW